MSSILLIVLLSLAVTTIAVVRDDPWHREGFPPWQRAAQLCVDDRDCRAKYNLGRTPTRAAGQELWAAVASHGLERETVDGCDDETLLRMLQEFHLVCVTPDEAVERAASAYHVGGMILVVFVTVIAHVGLFVLWNARAKKLSTTDQND